MVNGQIQNFVQFPESVMFHGNREISTVNIGNFTGNRDRDIELAVEIFRRRGLSYFTGALNKAVIHVLNTAEIQTKWEAVVIWKIFTARFLFIV